MKTGIPPERLKELKKKSDIFGWIVLIVIIIAVTLIIIINN
jgi:hypothetical protein